MADRVVQSAITEAGPVTGKAAVELVHDLLRKQILDGRLAPGVVVSQAQLARDLGVSRSPVREACRLLESEGLVDARHNHRVQVAEFSLEDLEEIYASRLVLETLAVSLKLPRLSRTDLDDMEDALGGMRVSAAERDYDRFTVPHDRFHLFLVTDFGYRMSRQIGQLVDHAQRYRRVYTTQTPMAWDVVLRQDTRILEAVRTGDFTAATEELARHLASTALSMIALIDPSYDPLLVRAALKQVCRET
ncbi:GntR family transcriptional regulator [Streptomyces uncialis]|uniref:GntR family transcriptional regulator n=1 Tax=Streptomyces uncialis TaxID=1048205 RepID=UPI0038632E89|nr:GntR family transcriptional regulator [Streptomyces uncialis]